LRLRERAAVPAAGAVGVAQVRPCHAPQSAAPPVPRGVSPDAPRDARRAGPGADSARPGRAAVRRTEGVPAAPGTPGRAQADPGGETAMRRLGRAVHSLLANALVALVRCYQFLLRPLLPSVCRYYPSCSEYFIEAVRKYGPVRGACKGVGRICRCNPW